MARLTDSRGGWFPDRVEWAIALGRLPGWSVFRKFGMNDNIDVGTEDIWPFGGLYTFPAAAAQVSLVSSSAQDAAAGTGVATVRIEGLSATYAEQSETVALTGVTPVLTSLSYLRVNALYALAPGSGSTTSLNAGSVTGTISGTTAVFMEVNEGYSHQLIYTVPLGKTLLVTGYDFVVGIDTGATKTLQHMLQVRAFGESWRALADVFLSARQYRGHGNGALIQEKSDCRARCKSTANSVPVSTSVYGLLIDSSVIAAL